MNTVHKVEIVSRQEKMTASEFVGHAVKLPVNALVLWLCWNALVAEFPSVPQLTFGKAMLVMLIVATLRVPISVRVKSVEL